MTKPTGEVPARAGGRGWLARRRTPASIVAFAPLCVLLMAADCEPGEGRRPPNFTIIPRSGAAAAPVPAAGSNAGAAGPVAGIPIPPAGGSGASGISGTAGQPPMGTSGTSSGTGTGTAGIDVPPPPLADGGLPEFDAGSEPARNMVSAGGICTRLAAIQCAAEAHCCTNARRTVAQCQTDQTNDCAKNGLFDDVAKNMVSGFDPSYAKAAFEQLEQFGTACDPAVAAWVIKPEGFRGIFQGTIAPNGSCRPSGFPSKVGYAAYAVSCQQPATHACLFVGSGPPAAPTAATCSPRTGAGSKCFSELNCQDGFFCENAGQKYDTGKCTALKPIGATCSLGVECATQVCVSAKCVPADSQNSYCLNPL